MESELDPNTRTVAPLIEGNAVRYRLPEQGAGELVKQHSDVNDRQCTRASLSVENRTSRFPWVTV
jgi:hypothetical protein